MKLQLLLTFFVCAIAFTGSAEPSHRDELKKSVFQETDQHQDFDVVDLTIYKAASLELGYFLDEASYDVPFFNGPTKEYSLKEGYSDNVDRPPETDRDEVQLQ